MSTLLQSLKPQVLKARNLAIYSKYSESITAFQQIITKISAHIPTIQDRNLLSQWNRLLEDLQREKQLSVTLKEVIQGNFDQRNVKKEKPKMKQEGSEKQIKLRRTDYEDMRQNPDSFKKVYKRAMMHEDDEVYNKKEKETKAKDREKQFKEKDDVQRELKEKEFLERQAEIWPKKKPILSKKTTSTNYSKPNYQPPQIANNSGVNKANRQYTKPWQNNAKNPNGKPAQGEQKKSFLKHCYPDGNGPDSNLIEMLEKQVITFNPDVTFDQIAELQKAKDVLEQAVLLPLLMPHLFRGIRRAWKGVLLFGPPGTGKTLLAKAIASGGKTTFFNVTASSLASKWRGQSQKLVRILFQMAQFYSPATIFIDQIDSLASKRGDKEDEASRKVKTEFMTRIDGVTSSEQGKNIVVIGATNRPWDLDEAIRRRLQKRIYIPLPTEIGRREMFKINLKDVQLQASVDIEQIVAKTDGYSGADICLLCREAAYMPMRRKLKKQGGLKGRLKNQQFLKEFQKDVTVPLTMQDFLQAVKNVKPSVGKNDLLGYQNWMKQFGQQGSN